MLKNYEFLQDRSTAEGRHLVLGDRIRRHRLLITPTIAKAPGYFVPQDRWLRTRLAAIESFDPSCRLFGPNSSNDVLFPTAAQKQRLMLMLRVLDTIANADNGFVSIRQIAQNIVYRNVDFGRTIEWKSSPHRRQTQRLISRAHFFVRGGYRILLHGKTQQRSDYS